jgi:acyl carrier protein
MVVAESASAQIKRLIAAELHIEVTSISDDMTIEDLGLDSLSLAEVVISLEKHFERPIDTTTFAEDLNAQVRVGPLLEIFRKALSVGDVECR